MQDLHVALVQFSPEWENPEANYRKLDSLVADTLATSDSRVPTGNQAAAADPTVDNGREVPGGRELPGGRSVTGTRCDVLVLPEMFSTGFSLRASALAEPMDGPGVRWMRATAARLSALVCGSLIIADHSLYYNRCLLVGADGVLGWYDKCHLFTKADEHTVFAPGDSHCTLTWKGWRIRPFICYDLRFPEWLRNRGAAYDLALVPASWPSARERHWRVLLQARAIENQCFVVGVNRLGTDGNTVAHDGASLVFDPLGEPLLDCAGQAGVFRVTLTASQLLDWRRRFPALRDMRE